MELSAKSNGADNSSAGSSELVLRVQSKSSSSSTQPQIGKTAPKAKTPKASKPFRFNPDSHLYMASACCEMLHYKHAALVVAGIEAVLMTVMLVTAGLLYFNQGFEWYYVSVQAGVACVMLVSIGLLVFGVRSERAWLLWPHLLMQMGLIACAIGLTVLAVLSMSLGTDYAELIFDTLLGPERSMRVQTVLGPVWPFCLAVIFDFQAALGIWCYILTRGCYDYLADKQYFQNKAQQAPAPAPSSSGSSEVAADTPSPNSTSRQLHTPDNSTLDRPAPSDPHDNIETIAHTQQF